jgi:hypothetical protein
MRSCGSPISPIAHITFWTFAEVLRPQILITIFPPAFFLCVVAGLVAASTLCARAARHESPAQGAQGRA